jgi:hypothetical protein
MQQEEIALNLRPGDAIKLDNDLWWTVTDHSVDMSKPAPISMHLQSRADPEFRDMLICNLTQRFCYEPRDN